MNELQPRGVVFPFENRNTSDAVAVAVKILGCRVDDNVGAEIQRPLKVRGHECIVDDDATIVPMCKVANGADVGNHH